MAEVVKGSEIYTGHATMHQTKDSIIPPKVGPCPVAFIYRGLPLKLIRALYVEGLKNETFSISTCA